MSISPRDAGIPMLTEVIEEEGMDFVGPLPDEAETAASAEAAQALDRLREARWVSVSGASPLESILGLLAGKN